ncbi:glutathione transferase [Emydomyces testavorans]|uniref:Glutathione transferase n=1 Tax=Emydomyces testavorans TaxID=2070801 RepID=A0AAF0DFV2_9EURO|nr:glutathione transferase [Emydomyces testavorans]
MAFTIAVPNDYGNVVAVALGAIPFLAFVHGAITTQIRKAARIPYPHCYATQEQCAKDPKAEQFNCAQRAHANYLENMPQTMIFILVAGLKHPRLATLLGTTWVALRVLYLAGYVFSGAKNGGGRRLGGPFWFVQGALWVISVFGMGFAGYDWILRN